MNGNKALSLLHLPSDILELILFFADDDPHAWQNMAATCTALHQHIWTAAIPMHTLHISSLATDMITINQYKLYEDPFDDTHICHIHDIDALPMKLRKISPFVKTIMITVTHHSGIGIRQRIWNILSKHKFPHLKNICFEDIDLETPQCIEMIRNSNIKSAFILVTFRGRPLEIYHYPISWPLSLTLLTLKIQAMPFEYQYLLKSVHSAATCHLPIQTQLNNVLINPGNVNSEIIGWMNSSLPDHIHIHWSINYYPPFPLVTIPPPQLHPHSCTFFKYDGLSITAKKDNGKHVDAIQLHDCLESIQSAQSPKHHDFSPFFNLTFLSLTHMPIGLIILLFPHLHTITNLTLRLSPLIFQHQDPKIFCSFLSHIFNLQTLQSCEINFIYSSGHRTYFLGDVFDSIQELPINRELPFLNTLRLLCFQMFPCICFKFFQKLLYFTPNLKYLTCNAESSCFLTASLRHLHHLSFITPRNGLDHIDLFLFPSLQSFVTHCSINMNQVTGFFSKRHEHHQFREISLQLSGHSNWTPVWNWLLRQHQLEKISLSSCTITRLPRSIIDHLHSLRLRRYLFSIKILGFKIHQNDLTLVSSFFPSQKFTSSKNLYGSTIIETTRGTLNLVIAKE